MPRGDEQGHEVFVDLALPFEVGQRRALPCSHDRIRELFGKFRAPRGGRNDFWQILDPREHVGVGVHNTVSNCNKAIKVRSGGGGELLENAFVGVVR